ncbi:MAG: CapA family protein [Clostridiales bacterium]|nr:CapA family protein [Clostridiales bacterium]
MKRTLIFSLILLLLFASAAAAETLTLSFIGDCSIGEKVESVGKAGSYTATVDEKGFDWPFSLVREYLEKDDFTFANNEVIFTSRKNHADKKTNLKAAAPYAQVYLHSGVDAVNTANNHAMDFFDEGYADTLAALAACGIPHFGTLYPDTKRAQDRLGVYEVKGIKIGAVGFSYPQDSDVKKIAERIQTLREEGCDLVVVALHWGREVQSSPQSWQFSYARKIIDAGADVIWGHHPHILQQVQFYQGKPIFYSTGNFTFGSMSNVDPDTGIFQLRYQLTDDGPVLENFTVIPCRTQGKGDYRPYPLTDPVEMETMLKKLIYKKTVKNMQNLPASFAKTGTVDLINGEFAE